MRAVAHGWHPDNGTGPTKKVAREFLKADSLRSRYHKAKERKSKLNKWAHGGDTGKSRKFAIGDAKSNVGEYKT